MKRKILSLAILFVLGTIATIAGTKTEKIKVIGNCDMCKARIEKAAKSLDGVSSANWNSETKILEVNYNDQKASTEQIQTSIAMAGHDTPLFSTSDKKYAELPGCCQYKRDEKRTVMNRGTNIECNHESTTAKGVGCGGSSSCNKLK